LGSAAATRGRSILLCLAAGLATSGLIASPGVATAATGTVSNYPTPGSLAPTSIASGPDGNLWFVSYSSSAVGRITPKGVVTLFKDATIAGPTAITAGPNGEMWFTNADNNTIAEIYTAATSGSAATAFTATNAGDISGPTAITVGPDGNVWFTNAGNNTIGRITEAGVTSHYAGNPGVINDPEGIAAGPDGMVWFTNRGNDTVDAVNTAMSGINIFSSGDPSAISSPESITRGPDDAMWITNAGSPTISRIPVNASITTYSGGAITSPRGITQGPDGALWFANSATNTIGRITRSGVSTAFPGYGISAPYAVAFGPGNALWFTNAGNNSIGRITTGATTGAVSMFGPPLTSYHAIARGRAGSLWVTDPVGGTMTWLNALGVTNLGLLGAYPGAWALGTGRAFWDVWASIRPGTAMRCDSVGHSCIYDVNPAFSAINGVAEGPDGAAWFTRNAAIGRWALPNGPPEFNTFTSSKVNGANGITAAPDGNLWFANTTGSTIGRITMTGAITTYASTAIYAPFAIVAGPDGALWFTSYGNSRIGRITTSGSIKTFTSPSIMAPQGIAVGPDGALWFANGGSGRIGRITTSGVVTSYPNPFGATSIIDITRGPDGAMWYVTAGPARIGRIVVTHDTAAPTTTGLRASIPSGTALVGSSVPVRVAWKGADTGGSGIDRYELGQQVNSASWTVLGRNYTSGSASVLLAPGKTYRFRTRGVDVAGNVGSMTYGPGSALRLVQEAASSITYSSGWHAAPSFDFSGGGAKYATKAGTSATYSFTGRSVALVSTLSYNRGKARVYVDGSLAATIDLYSATDTFRRIVWSKAWSSSATHKVKVVVVGTAGRPRVDIDAFAILG